MYGTLFSVTAATSILATLIIAYQIYSLTVDFSRHKRYWYIVEIMVQSVVIYSVLMLAQAICLFLNPGYFNEKPELYIVEGYFTTLGGISSVSHNLEYPVKQNINVSIIHQGAAPTLMVARLSLANEDRTERSNTTDLSSPQAELEINPEEHPVVSTNDITEIPRQEAESSAGRNDNVV